MPAPHPFPTYNAIATTVWLTLTSQELSYSSKQRFTYLINGITNLPNSILKCGRTDYISRIIGCPSNMITLLGEGQFWLQGIQMFVHGKIMMASASLPSFPPPPPNLQPVLHWIRYPGLLSEGGVPGQLQWGGHNCNYWHEHCALYRTCCLCKSSFYMLSNHDCLGKW